MLKLRGGGTVPLLEKNGLDAALRVAAVKPGHGNFPLTWPGAGGTCQMVTPRYRGESGAAGPDEAVAVWVAVNSICDHR